MTAKKQEEGRGAEVRNSSGVHNPTLSALRSTATPLPIALEAGEEAKIKEEDRQVKRAGLFSSDRHMPVFQCIASASSIMVSTQAILRFFTRQI
jgi:hypothetical protein